MSLRLRWVRGAAPRARYVGLGHASALFPWIDDLGASRSRLEQIALTVSTRVPFTRAVEERHVLEAWARIERLVPGIGSALLIYTGYYKDTVLSGVVSAERAIFVKALKSSSGHECECRNRELLERILPSNVCMPRVALACDGIVGYDLIPHASRVSPLKLADTAIEIGRNAWSRALERGAPVIAADRLAIDEGGMSCAAAGVALSARAKSVMSAYRDIEPLCHGDFTPWNLFNDARGRIVLVDYERIRPNVPFADLWHLATQPCVLRGRVHIDNCMIARVASAADVSRRTALSWYCAYLWRELVGSANDWVLHGRRYRRLHRAIVARGRILEAAVQLREDSGG